MIATIALWALKWVGTSIIATVAWAIVTTPARRTKHPVVQASEDAEQAAILAAQRDARTRDINATIAHIRWTTIERAMRTRLVNHGDEDQQEWVSECADLARYIDATLGDAS